MRSTNGQTGRTSYQSVYRSLEEVRTLLTRIYGPSLSVKDTGDTTFGFRTSTFRDSLVSLCHCFTNDGLNSSFNSDNDDIIIITKPKGDFAIHTWCGDYQLSRDVGFVFTMNHATGYSSTQSTATTTLQVSRSGLEAVLQRYSEESSGKWSGIQQFPLGGGFGHLIQALSNRYRENFADQADCNYSETSLRLVQDAAMVAVAELISRGQDSQRREKFTASRRNVMRAVDLINNQTAPLTIHDLATTLDISVRALQDGFRKHLNASPHALLKTGRLEGARRDLISGKVASVREVAAKWGFSNLARFSQEYFAVAGKSPRDTLTGHAEDDEERRLLLY